MGTSGAQVVFRPPQSNTNIETKGAEFSDDVARGLRFTIVVQRAVEQCKVQID